MTGRMAYIVMCIEKYLIIKYPDRDWRTLSKVLWKSTSMNWGDWAELYSNYIPDVILQYDAYDSDEFADYIDENTFLLLRRFTPVSHPAMKMLPLILSTHF